jgi:ribosomal protein S18 acetylase RimI-like enzyme
VKRTMGNGADRPPWRLRDPRPSDLAGLRVLLEACAIFRPAELEAALAGVDLALLRESGYEAVVAEDGGALAGFAVAAAAPLARGTHELLWIAVHPERRGRGLGRRLIRWAAERAREAGAHLVLVETSSRPGLLPARALYAAAGGVELARVPDYYGAGEDRLILRLPLPGSGAG